MLKQPENLGLYLPASFFIKLNTNESLLDLENCSEATKATFFHEYIHFLQDLFTLFGLRNINYLVNVVYSINQEILKLKEIKYPLIISDASINTQNSLFKFYYGTTFLTHDPLIITGYHIVPNGIIVGYEYIECIEIDTISLGGPDSFYLGAHIIIESMAYIIEKSIFKSYSTPIFPYTIVDLFIDSIFGELDLTMELKVVLCEESLNSGHPGLTFIKILEKLSERKMSFKNPAELSSFLRLQFFLQDENNVKYSISFALDSETIKTQSNLKKYFPDEKIVKINTWIDYIFDKVNKFRKQGFYFYKLYNNNEYFVEIINEIGTPLVADNRHYYFMNPKIDQSNCSISIFLAIRELMFISLGEQNNCNLKSRCSEVSPKLVNQNCDFQPQENRKREEKCDLSALMFLWGLK